jgi:hypothetical protein
MEIRAAPHSLNFKIEGDLLVRFNGAEIVRYFGQDREVAVGQKVKVLEKSCFEDYKHLERICFEVESELGEIDAAALLACVLLSRIWIRSSVRAIGASSFEDCTELELCFLSKDSSLVPIGARALRSFGIPRLVVFSIGWGLVHRSRCQMSLIVDDWMMQLANFGSSQVQPWSGSKSKMGEQNCNSLDGLLGT